MRHFRLTLCPALRQALQRKLTAAATPGELRLVNWMLALFAVVQAQDTAQAATVFQLSVAQVERWVYQFLVYGLPGVAFKKPSGRPAKLPPTPKAELQERLKAGPPACGFSGGCWRTPLLQALRQAPFGVTYNVFYLA